jgi:NAD(P)-dependent dehydrogenase (short-subunit alcohol dehydrogenase family)
MGICDGKVVIVTGAGRGIGRGHAIEFARQGAKVVVNDLGGEVDGTGGDTTPAAGVVAEIAAMGGQAVVNGDDVSEWEGAQRLVNQAIEHFGELHVVVNNAGILRDRMLTNMTEGEWDAVIKVHLKGTFAPSRWAAAYWRERAKAGNPVEGAAIVNTSSTSGLYGNPGQVNYGAAKAGIAAFTIIASAELQRYGVTVNAVSPGARTRMTENLPFGQQEVEEGAFDARHADNIAPTVVWLGSNEPAARQVTGRVFLVSGGSINCMEGWEAGPGVSQADRWEPGQLTAVIPSLVEQAAENVIDRRLRARQR